MIASTEHVVGACQDRESALAPRGRRASSVISRVIRTVDPTRQRIYGIQNNLSANGHLTSGLARPRTRSNWSRLQPTPASSTGSRATSVRSKSSCSRHRLPRLGHRPTRARGLIRHRNGRDHDRRIAVLERKHRVTALTHSRSNL
jgi:hypothetical protein